MALSALVLDDAHSFVHHGLLEIGLGMCSLSQCHECWCLKVAVDRAARVRNAALQAMRQKCTADLLDTDHVSVVADWYRFANFRAGSYVYYWHLA